VFWLMLGSLVSGFFLACEQGISSISHRFDYCYPSVIAAFRCGINPGKITFMAGMAGKVKNDGFCFHWLLLGANHTVL
ncbi:MAG: hypothetical protein KC931_12650, partial [Candidatus Omnitrophica bacterium]|nr:hypothetical protein [Candidatus Omnitrophota bacterium]